MTSPNDRGDDRIDRTIDDVARAMTAGDVSANLRARVLQAIDGPRQVTWRPLIATAFAACAVALIVVAINVPRSGVAPPATSQRVPEASARVPATLARVPEASPRVPAASPRVPQAAPRVPANVARVPDTSPNLPFTEERLKEESIAVESIAIAPMAPNASIAVDELPTITPLALPAIGQGEQR